MNQLVRTSLLFLSFLMGLVAIVPAQTVDVTKVLADPKTYTFSDNKHTVKTYIYETLEAQTTCCGPARMYLEVKIDPSGYVLNVKPLTGQTQECYAKSVQDIVKNIKWNAQGFTAAKSIYFEIKPSIECGEGRNNAYTQVSIFNNEKVDANGVPLNYASSTGISASAAAGTSGTPSVPAAEAGTPAEEAVAANTGGSDNEGGNEAEEGKEGGLPTPPGTKPKTSTSEPATGTVATGVPDKTRSSANAEMETALEMAKKDREAQEAEIQRLKDELAAAKEAEEQRKKEEEEAAARAEKEAEEARLAEQRAKEEERERLRQERERERERLAAERNRDNRDDRRDGGFRDVDYSDNGRGDRDRYADNRDQDPPQRQMTEVERRQKEADDLRGEMDELNRRIREADNNERNSQRERERLANDLIRLEERRLKADAAIAEAREKEELDRINQSIREAEEQQREKDRLVQEKMREMERMKSDLERAVADLERFEEQAKQKAAEKATKEAEIAQAQAERTAEMEAKLATMRLESGDPDAVAEGVQQPFTGNDDVTRQLEILRQQILILTQQINDMRNGGSGFSGGAVARNGGTSRGGTQPTSRRSTAKTNGDFKSAAANRDWEKLKSIDDILDPNRTEEYPENTFETVSEPAPGQEVAEANSPGNPEHMNIAGPKFTKPVYTGGVTAMKQFVADELKKNSVCGLAHTAFEVTIDGSGKVLAHNVLAVNNQNLLLYLPAIINRMQFQATGSGLPVRAVYELKADINCEGVEKVDLNSVPNMIRN